MSQRIRVAESPDEQVATARLLGRSVAELETGISLLWTVGRRVAGVAHICRVGRHARVDAFALFEPGDDHPGGAIALSRMALATAVPLGNGEIELCPALLEDEAVCQALHLVGPRVTVDQAASRALDLPAPGRLAWERRIFERGQIIARVGDPAEVLRVVARGSVRLVGVDHKGSPREIGQMGPGELLGDTLLAGATREPLHILAQAAQVDLMAVPRAVVEAHRHTPEWSAWIQRALVRRIASLSGRLLNGVEPQIMAHVVEILVDLAVAETPRCSLRWLAEQVGVHTQRARVLLEPLWEAVGVRGDDVAVHDLAALEGQQTAALVLRAPQRRELVLCQPTL